MSGLLLSQRVSNCRTNEEKMIFKYFFMCKKKKKKSKKQTRQIKTAHHFKSELMIQTFIKVHPHLRPRLNYSGCISLMDFECDFLCVCPLLCCLQSVSRLFSLRSVKKRCVWWVCILSLTPADALK